LLNENTTDSFIVNSKTKKIMPMHGNSYDYFRGDKKGTADMIIEVFAGWHHEQYAKEIYDALKAAGLENKYFSIKIDPR
jgi:hypothetical protein